MAKGFYGVRVGRVPGVYTDWDSCKAQVNGCSNEYRGFDTYAEAAAYVAKGPAFPGTARPANRKRRRRAAWSTDLMQAERPALSAISNNSVSQPQVKVEAFDASQSYFSQVPNFVPDDNADFDIEFGRFASSQNIPLGSKAWRQERTNAIRHEVIFHYSQAKPDDKDGIKKEEEEHDSGLSAEEKKRKFDLQVLQNMCREVKLEPLDTIEGCRANIRGVLVNIVDYINAKRNGAPIKVWPPHQFEQFRCYSLRDDKRIDLEEAKSGDGFLVPLLQILRFPNAAANYMDRVQYAARVQQDYTRRTSSNNVANRQTEQHLTVIKEEPETPHGILNEKCEVVSIHGSESEPSSPRAIKEEESDITPWSSSVIGSPVAETPKAIQQGTKRGLDDLAEQDILQEETPPASAQKRLRV
ncbi:hypothetical protein F5Y10DRAFT_218208 [Nemania abortiva]|nr:hypothetical protein F5Y10DRAFT_218208 [Nemania abortiva]